MYFIVLSQSFSLIFFYIALAQMMHDACNGKVFDSQGTHNMYTLHHFPEKHLSKA